MFSFSVLLSGLCMDQTHQRTQCELQLLPFAIRVVAFGSTAVLFLAFLCSKTLNNISSRPLQAPSSITVWGCERSEWRWFRHFRALGAALGSHWNHKPAQVTHKFVAFRFLYSSGTKWSLNLVIYPTCPSVALLDLELGNYTSGLRGEEGEMWFWAKPMSDGSLHHRSETEFLIFFSLRDQTPKHDRL